MKGSTTLCPTCGTSFVKKTHHHVHCKTGCRVRHYRKKHGLSEPDFGLLKQNSVRARLQREEADREHAILNLIEELETLEEFHAGALRDLTSVILEYPMAIQFFVRRANFSAEGHENSGTEQKRVSAHDADFGMAQGIKRFIATDKSTGDTLDTDELAVWDVLTAEEQIRYMGYVVHFARVYHTDSLQRPLAGTKTVVARAPKAREDLHTYTTGIIQRIAKEKAEVEQEIERHQRLRARRMAYFGTEVSSQSRVSVGSSGGGSSSGGRVPAPSGTAEEPLIITTASKLERAHSPALLPLREPFAALLGKNIPFNPYIILWGDAGSGKTSFTLQLLKAVTPAQQVALCTAEASLMSGDSPLVALARITKTKDIPLVQTHSISAVERVLGLKKFTCIAIDSASRLGLTPEQVLEWHKAMPTMMFIVLLESTKGGGEFKGDNMWKHHCNIMIRAEVMVNTKGVRTKSRYVVEKNQYGTYGDIML